MLKTIFHNTGEILQRPFREHLIFLIAFFVLATSPFFIKYINASNYHYSSILTIQCAAISYCVTLLVGLIPHQAIRRTVQTVLIVLSSAFFILNIYCLFELHSLVDADYIMLIMGTNVNEAREFASQLIPIDIVLGITGVLSILGCMGLIARRHPMRMGKKWSIAAAGVALLCMMWSIHTWRAWKDGPVGHLSDILTTFNEYEMPDESQLHHEVPEIALDETQELPTSVVLIIGESFARFHSSLYGYEKSTNPCLEDLHDKSLLYTIDSIDAPAPITNISLQYMMTSFSKADAEGKDNKWYEFPSVMEMMSACGYDCYWFSNQARTGRFNYIARVFAESCKKCFFYQQEGALNNNSNLDVVLADSSRQFIRQLDIHNKRHFMVYHMMGSHFDYSKRYTREFNRFSQSDYAQYPQNQRKILASYDNSILYNDYIVSQIIDIYKNEEAVIVYVPDHGQDMFRSSPDYYSHGKMNDPKSFDYGVEIPFMIYASPAFQQKHPQVMQRIKYRQDHPKAWNSDDLPYLIMDLIGVKTIGGEDVKSKSVLN